MVFTVARGVRRPRLVSSSWFLMLERYFGGRHAYIDAVEGLLEGVDGVEEAVDGCEEGVDEVEEAVDGWPARGRRLACKGSTAGQQGVDEVEEALDG